GDGPATDPVPLQHLSAAVAAHVGNITIDRAPFLPLYQPNGALAGIVAMDDATNLNFYPDETFTNPTRLLTSIKTFWAKQDPATSQYSDVSANPGYSYLIVEPQTTQNQGYIEGPVSLYRVDSSGSISPDLYDFAASYPNGVANGLFVDSGNVYF